jgi:hypothetical protein
MTPEYAPMQDVDKREAAGTLNGGFRNLQIEMITQRRSPLVNLISAALVPIVFSMFNAKRFRRREERGQVTPTQKSIGN